MTTNYALRLKLDLVLNDQPQRMLRNGHAVWDFDPEQRLIWIDPDNLDHTCETPPVTLPLDYRLRTLCGRTVSTTRMRLVDTDERPLPTCPHCFHVHLKRQHEFAAANTPGFIGRRTASTSVAISLFVALLLLAPSLDDLAPGPDPAPQDIAHGPSMDDPDPMDDIEL